MSITTSKAHPITSAFQKSSQPPSTSVHINCPGVKNSLHHSGGSGLSYPEATVISGSNVSLEFNSKNEGIALQSALPSRLYSHPYYKKYFFGKLQQIERLEMEISRVEIMSAEQYDAYRNENCPLLKTKNQLISNNFYFIKYYSKQMQNVWEQHGKTT